MRRNFVQIPLFSAAFLLVGCVNTPPNSPTAPVGPSPGHLTPLPESQDGIARARLGERVYVDGPYVTPLAVLEDSRCPSDPGVRCVWAGQVRLSIRVELGSGPRDHEITTREHIHIADGNLQLVEVTPPRTQNGPNTPQDYVFGFRFMGGL